eukprot:gene14493-14617_t
MSSTNAVDHRASRGTGEWDTAQEDEDHGQEQHKNTRWGTLLLAYASLGVIYGDIGTSPLYTFATSLPHHPSAADVLGVSSLIFWIMTLIVLVKYVLIVLRADDNGEGGTFAMYSLLCRSIGITPFGKEVELEDCDLRRYSHMPLEQSWSKGVLTPCISVLGAVDGLRVATQGVSPDAIVGVSVAVLVVLFTSQRYGSGAMGAAFAPIVIIWLTLNAGVGVYQLAKHGGDIFASLNPLHIVDFFA